MKFRHTLFLPADDEAAIAVYTGWRLMRYSKGNRKIHTISTKCQYNPKFSIGATYPALNSPRLALQVSQNNRTIPMIIWSACLPVIAKYRKKNTCVFYAMSGASGSSFNPNA